MLRQRGVSRTGGISLFIFQKLCYDCIHQPFSRNSSAMQPQIDAVFFKRNSKSVELPALFRYNEAIR